MRPWLPWWRRFLGLGVALGVVYFAVPSPVSKVMTWGVAGLAPVVAILVGVRWHRPARAGAWLLFAAGQAAFTVGDMIFYVNDYLLHHELPLPPRPPTASTWPPTRSWWAGCCCWPGRAPCGGTGRAWWTR